MRRCICNGFEYYGKFCEKTFDPCFNVPSPCLNTGICEDIPRNERKNNKTFTCACPSSYSGEHCENSKHIISCF